MGMLIGVLLYCVLIATEAAKNVLCPVSTIPNFTGNHDHLYPMEIYHTDRIVNGVPIDPFERCNMYGRDSHTNFSCPLQSVGCPLIENNVVTGLSISLGWKKSTSLCTLKKKLEVPGEPINVLVFGGSVTKGCDTAFCCPLPECNIKEGARCAWPHYVEPWLRSIGKANVNVYNLGRGGTTSATSSEQMQDYLDHIHFTNLTKNDLVFIDHSFNDNAMCSVSDSAKVERGLEKLIRRLLTLTANETPTIILMETDTRVSAQTPYPKTYRRIAKHYGIRIYSYMEAIHANHSMNYQKAYHHHLTHHHRHDDHPPWHTHLIYADFVSALLLHEMNECDTTYKLDGATPFILPAALTSANDSAHCDPKHAPLLRVSYDDIQEGTVLGDYWIPNNGTWQVRPDRKGRGGIIAELNATDKFEVVQNAPLYMNLSITVGQLKKIWGHADVVLQMSFLMSYFNSGIVRMEICGDMIFGGNVDALWHDWKTYHYTTTELFTWKITNCNQPDHEFVRIGVKHWMNPEIFDSQNLPSAIEKTPRTKQFFKINSVTVCRYL